MRLLKIAGIILVGSLGALFLAGYFLPEWHISVRAIRLNRPPGEVWDVLTDYPQMPSWRSELQKVERVETESAGVRRVIWNEHLKNGFVLPLEDVRSDPPHLLVRRVADPKMPFGGAWKFELQPEAGGSRVRLTETGYVRVPLFRVFSRFSDMSRSTEEYLQALARRLGEPARFVERPPVRYLDNE